ncbi:MAG TPA: P1 family peptidase [Actinomycetota bacterium]|nr:P1 family peptidase [Actinomycetota bacterium]
MADRRARDLGIRIGAGRPGPLNAITDVAGVRAGHRTITRGDDGDPHAVRTGVTAIFPHDRDPWDAPVFAATHILNGYGELIGVNSIREWGILESPIVLTSSLQIGKAYDATVRWIASRSREAGEAVMPCVTECDDSWLSDVLSFPLEDDDVVAALDGATGGPVTEGCVGGGTGMQCFDFKGGIGTASRVLAEELGGHTVGVLVMTNHGTRPELLIDGVRVGDAITDLMPAEHSEGSCIVVVATDAPLLPHQLRRVAERAGMGLSRGGSTASNSSGEQFLAFSTAHRLPTREPTVGLRVVADGGEAGGSVMSALFRATVEATEEAVVNALVAAETTVGRDGRTYHALPVDRTLELLRAHGRLPA